MAQQQQQHREASLVLSQSEHKALFALKKAVSSIGFFLYKHWATLATVLMGLIELAALSVPVLSYLGLDDFARPIFAALHMICAQIPSHSFYIFGHQFGMCARNILIYGSMFVVGLVFVLSKKRLPGIPWWLLVFLALPMAWDGFTQMFGLRESTWELRVITGTLFGMGCAWFAFPLVQKFLLETPMVDRGSD